MKNTENLGKTLDTYLGLCTEVYELSKPSAPKDVYAFYREYAQAANGPVLEPMCGTGRFLLPLLEEKFDITGFDASAHMLSRLHEKAKEKSLKPNVWQGFAQDLNQKERYNLIFIPSGSFCLITDENEVKLILNRFYNHLTRTGILLFEAETMKAIPKLNTWRTSIWPKLDGTSIVLDQLATFDAGICTSLGKYALLRDGNIIHTEIEKYEIKIYQHSVLKQMLQAAGFRYIRTVKAFDKNDEPTEDDESVVYECRK